MGEPKRPVQGRSAVPEFNNNEFALHHGSIAGRLINDLGTGNNTAEATPEAIQRLMGMLSSIRGDADGDAAVVTPVQRNLFTRLMATLDDQRDQHAVDLPRGGSMPAVGKSDDGIAADDPADDARVQNAALQQRVVALRERAIAMRNERMREQERQLLDEARQQAEGEAQLILRDERSTVSDERVQPVYQCESIPTFIARKSAVACTPGVGFNVACFSVRGRTPRLDRREAHCRRGSGEANGRLQ